MMKWVHGVMWNQWEGDYTNLAFKSNSKISTFPPPITLAPPGWTPATLPEIQRLYDRVACLARTERLLKARLIMKPNPLIKIVRPGEGEAVWALGEKLTFKLGPEDTGGAFSLTELTAQPRNGPPPHLHHREDELFYVLDGEFTFVLGDRAFTRAKGFAACLPKKVLHTYSNIGSRPAKMLVIAAPSGFESFVREWSHPVRNPDELPPAPTQQDIDKLMAAAGKFGLELHPEAKAVPDAGVPVADPSYWVLGQFVTVKLTALQTAGQFSLAEITCPPGTVVPNHLHVAMDEIFYIIEGTAEFTSGERVEYLEKGSLVFVPRGVAHGFRNTGSAPVRLFDAHTPAGFEDFFREAGVPATDPNSPPPPPGPPPPPDQLLALLRKHGMEFSVA